MTEDEMVGWRHRLNGHEFEQAPGDSEGQRSPVCCCPEESAGTWQPDEDDFADTKVRLRETK